MSLSPTGAAVWHPQKAHCEHENTDSGAIRDARDRGTKARTNAGVGGARGRWERAAAAVCKDAVMASFRLTAAGSAHPRPRQMMYRSCRGLPGTDRGAAGGRREQRTGDAGMDRWRDGVKNGQ
ncbi:hypothetical protein Bbelb_172360 [Branchiostoma belcheri]|nr:hypothetical protein Bbelb_172360 [Branchiostoma belcheri]